MTDETPLIRILSVDDHPLLRSGIGALIATQSDMQLVAEAANGKEAVQLYRELRPDVTLMDLQTLGLKEQSQHGWNAPCSGRRPLQRAFYSTFSTAWSAKTTL